MLLLPKKSFERAHDMNSRGTSRRRVIATAHRSRHPVAPWLAAIGLAIGVSLGACGDKDKDSTPVKTTSYQGKPGTAPWDDSHRHGDLASSELAITAR